MTAVYSDGVEKESEHKFYNGSGISGIENDGLRIYPTPVDNTVNIEGNFDSLTLWSLDHPNYPRPARKEPGAYAI